MNLRTADVTGCYFLAVQRIDPCCCLGCCCRCCCCSSCCGLTLERSYNIVNIAFAVFFYFSAKKMKRRRLNFDRQLLPLILKLWSSSAPGSPFPTFSLSLSLSPILSLFLSLSPIRLPFLRPVFHLGVTPSSRS